MKYLIIILFAFTLFSCSKEKGACIECDTLDGDRYELCFTYDEAMTSLDYCNESNGTACVCEKLREIYN